jgi:hypothetical protein
MRPAIANISGSDASITLNAFEPDGAISAGTSPGGETHTELHLYGPTGLPATAGP